MKVTGFTFIKNAIIYDYPIVESIKSILPICNEFVVAIGKSNDATLALINSIASDKIKIIETEWDESIREDGKVLAAETDKAFKAISKDSDWAFYIQGDEVVHEKYLDVILQNMRQYKDIKYIDGLLFKYHHFYGSYDYIGAASNWYKNEIRVIRNNASFYSYQDAQGFRKNDNKKLKVRPIDAYIYHYGWVKEPAAMQKKQENFNKHWHNDKWINENIAKVKKFEYEKNIRELIPFKDSHPKVMLQRITDKNWKFDYDISLNQKTLKDWSKKILKKLGLDFEYKNYEIG